MCLYPRLIENRKYRANMKNGGKIPPLPDQRVRYVPIGCQYCIECRKQKAREWQARLLEDIKANKNGIFVTLTLSDEKYSEHHQKVMDDSREMGEEIAPTGYELDNRVATKAIRLFLERWRKKYGVSVRHWLVTELGHKGTENIHLHGIIWTEEGGEAITERWQNGFTWIGDYVNEKTVNYIVKYINKVDAQHKYYKAKVLASKGIGSNYTGAGNKATTRSNEYNGEKTNEAYRTRTGHKMAMPIYWRNKIYSEHEREQLWLQKLNKEIRWVCGEKVDISKGSKKYDRLVQWYRQINNKMGYGGQENGNRKSYEESRRTIMQETRIQKAKAKNGS